MTMYRIPSRSGAVGVVALAVLAALAMSSHAAVKPEEAARLKTDLTPLGGERAGNKDGSIPAWTGGYTKPIPGFVNGGRRGDPFSGEKPILTINAANLAQYAARLNEGTQALIKKYPDSYRVDVYPTYRTAAAPQWVYDNTFRNATTAKLEGGVVTGAFGGIPFPIPGSALEIMANHQMRWRGTAFQNTTRGYIGTADGQHVLSVQGLIDIQLPYYDKDERDKFKGDYWTIRMASQAPVVRAGELITGRENLDPDKTATWVYLTGQRRVRKLPNACCDTPAPASSGLVSFDETDVFSGRTDRFDWKIVGKQEMYIPYNSNRLYTPTKDSDVLMAHHLNPDHVRWELHRVWVVEATLRAGQRHQAARSRYYIDEDTWVAVLADRWDANGKLWKTLWSHPVVMPDLPATTPQQQWGFNDLISGAWFADGVVNEQASQYKIVPRRPDTFFTPEAMTGDGVR